MMSVPRFRTLFPNRHIVLVFTCLTLVAVGCGNTRVGTKTSNDGTGGSLEEVAGASGDGDTGDGDGDNGDGDGDGDGDGASGGATGTGASDPGGSDSGGSDSGGSGGSEEQGTDAPTVVSATPADGATGVRADADIVIQFSEAMDTAATQAAFRTDTISGGIAYLWDKGDTELTIRHVVPLEYASGESPDITARAYDYSFTNKAQSLAGIPLDSFEVSFTTLRVLDIFLSGVPNLDGWARDDGLVSDQGTDTAVGYDGNLEIATLFTFDLSPLPDNIVEFETATLSAEQIDNPKETTAYDQFGDVKLYHLTFDMVDWSALAVPPIRYLGIFSANKFGGLDSLPVIVALTEDYSLRTMRKNRSQYGLRFSEGPGANTEYTVSSYYTAEHAQRYPTLHCIALFP